MRCLEKQAEYNSRKLQMNYSSSLVSLIWIPKYTRIRNQHHCQNLHPYELERRKDRQSLGDNRETEKISVVLGETEIERGTKTVEEKEEKK